VAPIVFGETEKAGVRIFPFVSITIQYIVSAEVTSVAIPKGKNESTRVVRVYVIKILVPYKTDLTELTSFKVANGT
jgi:hypothetical protein